MKFSRRNYNQWKTVTLAATEDADHDHGQATFRIFGEHVTDASLTATEIDNDSPAPAYQIVSDREAVDVEEGGTAVVNIKLSADPGRSVAVTIGHALTVDVLDDLMQGSFRPLPPPRTLTRARDRPRLCCRPRIARMSSSLPLKPITIPAVRHPVG